MNIKISNMKRDEDQKNKSGFFPFFKNRIVFYVLMSNVFIVTSCNSYQYLFVGSRLPQTELKEYIVENDTVLMKYSFKGINFPIIVTVFNKLDQPLYFDISRSTVVINGVQAFEPFYLDGQVSFIAPRASVTILSNPLWDSFIEISAGDSLLAKKKKTSEGTVYSFREETTPLSFRCILALAPNDDYSYPTFYDYSFWVSDIIRSMSGPKSISYNPSNQFYFERTTFFGKTLLWTGIVVLLLLGGAGSGQ
jgi:hypothetical protein